jgi:hypothetical protein
MLKHAAERPLKTPPSSGIFATAAETTRDNNAERYRRRAKRSKSRFEALYKIVTRKREARAPYPTTRLDGIK